MTTSSQLMPVLVPRFSPQGETATAPDCKRRQTPPDSLADRHLLKLETTGLTRQASQTRFEFDRVIVTQQIVSKLDSAGRPDLADPLRECHQHFTIRQCTGCRKTTRFWNHCDTSWCPNCQPKLARERFEEINFWAETARQAKHVVLTVANVPVLTKSYVRRIRNAFTKLRRSKLARNWDGGCFTMELTHHEPGSVKNGVVLTGGWHLHIHALVDARWIDASALAVEWGKRVGQDFGIVKVKDCRGKDYLREVTKYAVKGTDLAKWAGEHIIEFALAFKGVRTFGTFGTLYRRRAEWAAFKEQASLDRSLCECGCDTYRLFSPDEWEWYLATSGPCAPPKVIESDRQLEFGLVR